MDFSKLLSGEVSVEQPKVDSVFPAEMVEIARRKGVVGVGKELNGYVVYLSAHLDPDSFPKEMAGLPVRTLFIGEVIAGPAYPEKESDMKNE